MLLLRRPGTGETSSSFSLGTVPLLPKTRSDLAAPRRASGVATGGLWSCGVAMRDATFGVNGCLLIPLATEGTVSGRVVGGDGFSYGILVVGAFILSPGDCFICPRVAVTFWSRIRNGGRSDALLVADAVDGIFGAGVAAVVVVVSRVVRPPDADVVVVKIPADGLRLTVDRGGTTLEPSDAEE